MTEGELTGTLIDGRYRVGAVIGSGGFGVVYTAVHVGLDAKVALKVPRVDRTSPGEAAEIVAAFLEEARTLKRLRHPNLVGASDVGTLPPDAAGFAVPYLVLEWCEGPTLKEWLDGRRAPRSASEAWALLRPVVEAVAHAHEEGVVHRDLKPANILLEASRGGAVTPRVIDFGIAKRVDPEEAAGSGATQTTSENRSFTPRYAAPEQLMGLRTGAWTDVWALAVIFLEVVGGKPVFDSNESVRRAILEANLPTPTKLGLDVAPWGDVLARALAVRAPERHRDARELLAAMDAAGAGVTPADPFRAVSSAPGATPSAAPSGPLHPPQQAASGLGHSGVSAASAPRSADATLDATAVPSSSTLRTDATAGRVAPRAAGRMGLIVAAAVALGGVAAVGISQVMSRSDAAPDASSAPPSPAAASEATPARALSSLTAAEIEARARAAGLGGCTTSTVPGQVMVSCGGGYIMMTEETGPSAADAEIARANLQWHATLGGSGYGAARFTRGSGRGIVITVDKARIDALTTHVLAGIDHDPIGTEVQPRIDGATPSKLVDWKPRDLVRQVLAAGGVPLNIGRSGDMVMFTFTLAGEGGNISLLDGDADAYLQSARGGLPFSYAVDGRRFITCYGKGALAQEPFLKKLLGATKVDRLGSSR